MKKRYVWYLAAVPILLFGPAAITKLAFAKSENAAEITSDFRCFVPNADWSGTVMGVANNRSVVKRGARNMTMLRCTVHDVPNNTGKAVHFFNFPCGTFMGMTTDSRLTISASGVATLTCMIHHGDNSGGG